MVLRPGLNPITYDKNGLQYGVAGVGVAVALFIVLKLDCSVVVVVFLGGAWHERVETITQTLESGPVGAKTKALLWEMPGIVNR